MAGTSSNDRAVGADRRTRSCTAVRWQTVASAHDRSALLCEVQTAAAGSHRDAAEIGSDVLHRRGDAPRKRAGTVPGKRAGTAPRRRAEIVLQRRAQAARIWNRREARRPVSAQCAAPAAGSAPLGGLVVSAEQVSSRMIQSALLKHRSRLWSVHWSPAWSISNASY